MMRRIIVPFLAAFTPACCGSSSIDAAALERHLAASNHPGVICGTPVGIEAKVTVSDFRITRDQSSGRGTAKVVVVPTKAAGYPDAPASCAAEIAFETGRIARMAKKAGVVGHTETIRRVTVTSRSGEARVEPKVPWPPHPEGLSYEGFAGTPARGKTIHQAIAWGDAKAPDGRRYDDLAVFLGDATPFVVTVTPGASGDAPGKETPLAVEVYRHETATFDAPVLVERVRRKGAAFEATLRGPGTYRVRVTTEGPGLQQGSYSVRSE